MVKLSNRHLFLAVAVFVSLILFYIDEGYYNFQWMKSWGNWIVFGIYSIVFFAIQIIISYLLKKFFNITNQVFVPIVVGIPLAFIILIGLIFSN